MRLYNLVLKYQLGVECRWYGFDKSCFDSLILFKIVGNWIKFFFFLFSIKFFVYYISKYISVYKAINWLFLRNVISFL